ncbi:protein NYNRIN-like [Mergus octosetaceus]
MELLDMSKEKWREEFPALWARSELDCGLVDGEVEVRTTGPVPFQTQKPFSRHVEEVVASILQEMLDAGVVVRGTSSSNSPLWLDRRGPEEIWRLTLNCDALNSVTTGVATESLSKTQVVMALSPHSRFFSVVDLARSSFAIPLAPSCRALFAFTFQGRQYLFARLPPRFCGTTSIVHRRVVQMLSRLPPADRGWVSSYTDDIIIAGRTQEEMEARTKRVLGLIQSTGFKAKLHKAQLVQPAVDYLGMTLTARGREITESNLELVRAVSCPRNLHQLQQRLGWLSSLQEHVEGYKELAEPLQRLTRKEEEWVWGPEQQQALSRLQRAILAAPALRFPEKSEPFVIRLRASQGAVGAALLQEDERGMLVPVSFSSRLLKAHEVRYSPGEKGCLAALWALKAFEEPIGPAPVVIQMPHSPWKYLLWGETRSFCWPSPAPEQWTLLLVNRGERSAQPNGGHPPYGSPVPPAPALVLLPPRTPPGNVWFTAGSVQGQGGPLSFGFAAANLAERWLLGLAKGGSAPSAELAAIWELLRRHCSSLPLYVYASSKALVKRLRGEAEEWGRGPGASSEEELWLHVLRWVRANPGVLHLRHAGEGEEAEWSQKVAKRAQRIPAGVKTMKYRQNWEPSKHEKQEIIARCHRGHKGVQETLAAVRQLASWEGDSGEVTRWVQSCPRCARAPGEAGISPPQRPEGPWSCLQLGFIQGLPPSEEGLRCLLVAVDEASRWPLAFPMRQPSAEEAARLLGEQIWEPYGTPHAVGCQQGSAFLWDALQQSLGATGTLQPPQNSLAPIVGSLQRLAQSAGKSWVRRLPLILAAVRSLHVLGEALGPHQIIPNFPLELRLSPCEDEEAPGPLEPFLPWLARLRRDGGIYGQRGAGGRLGGTRGGIGAGSGC